MLIQCREIGCFFSLESCKIFLFRVWTFIRAWQVREAASWVRLCCSGFSCPCKAMVKLEEFLLTVWGVLRWGMGQSTAIWLSLFSRLFALEGHDLQCIWTIVNTVSGYIKKCLRGKKQLWMKCSKANKRKRGRLEYTQKSQRGQVPCFKQRMYVLQRQPSLIFSFSQILTQCWSLHDTT